jgi:uncharacterized membrane protein
MALGTSRLESRLRRPRVATPRVESPMPLPQPRPDVSAKEFLIGGLQLAFYAAYPVLIYLAHTRLPTRSVAALVLILLAATMLLRMRTHSSELWQIARPHLPLFGLIAAAMALNERLLLLLLPVVVSSYLFATFAWSLRRGPSMIERFARLIEDDLPEFTAPYCRVVTALWAVFLALNAVIVALLAARAPLGWWAAYTGPGFYVLLATLLGAELCFRKWWFRYYGDGLVDRVLARWFPAEETARGRRSLAYVERRRSASPQ